MLFSFEAKQSWCFSSREISKAEVLREEEEKQLFLPKPLTSKREQHPQNPSGLKTKCFHVENMKCTFFLVKREGRKQKGSDQGNADRNSSQVSFFAYHPIYTEQGKKPSTTANPEHF